MGIPTVRLTPGVGDDVLEVIRQGRAGFIFTSPEAVFPAEDGGRIDRRLEFIFSLQFLSAIVIDECHTMCDW